MCYFVENEWLICEIESTIQYCCHIKAQDLHFTTSISDSKSNGSKFLVLTMKTFDCLYYLQSRVLNLRLRGSMKLSYSTDLKVECLKSTKLVFDHHSNVWCQIRIHLSFKYSCCLQCKQYPHLHNQYQLLYQPIFTNFDHQTWKCYQLTVEQPKEYLDHLHLSYLLLLGIISICDFTDNIWKCNSLHRLPSLIQQPKHHH